MGKKLNLFFLLYTILLTIISNPILPISSKKKSDITIIKNWEYSYNAEENYKKNFVWKDLESSEWFKTKQEIDPLLLSRNSKPPIVWIRTKVPGIQRENYFVMRKYFISAFYEVYFNEKKIYSYKHFPSLDFIPLLIIELVYAPLPQAKEGEYIYIRTDFLVL